jgi:hypothetical protein
MVVHTIFEGVRLTARTMPVFGCCKQSVLQGKIAQNFLKVLLALCNTRDPLKIGQVMFSPLSGDCGFSVLDRTGPYGTVFHQ